MTQINIKPNTPVPLKEKRNWPESVHIFDARSIAVVNAALATGRPLLVQGEPGTGKSQLARAVAATLKCPFLSTVVNARFEPEDLLYRFDAVARLAEAQIAGAAGLNPDEISKRLNPRNFLIPQILWWAFSPGTALEYHQATTEFCGEAGCDWSDELGLTENDTEAKAKNCVVLIDEIDKADSELPNSLLETLSLNGFQLPFGGETISADAKSKARPFVVITTNEDRELPPAFVRRCWVLNLDPDKEPDIDAYFRTRVEAHFEKTPMDKAVVDLAIVKLKESRDEMAALRLTKPGMAELLDLLHAISTMATNDQKPAVKSLAEFAFSKHRNEG